ncbi:MAG: hypothetical protein AABW50_02740 [Nanoarchaeota archaeon]
MSIKNNLQYLDGFLNPVSDATEAKIALTRAFNGDEGEYNGLEYSTPYFRAEVIDVFSRGLAEAFFGIYNDQKFIEAIEVNPDLEERLKKLDNDLTIGIGAQVKKISYEDWVKGERGSLTEAYQELSIRYYNLRKELEKLEDNL